MTSFSKLQADVVAKAFNDTAPSHWRARAYLKARQNGTFNICKFTYKGGMVSFSMNCDEPVGQGFTIEFKNYIAAWGDYTVAIQKGLYQILTRLRDAEMASHVPPLLSPSEIMFGVRKDGAVTYLVVYKPSAVHVLADNVETFNELSYNNDESQVRLDSAPDPVDDLL